MRDLAFLAIFAFMLLPALRYVHAGSMLWAWTALCAPAQYLYGLASALPLNKIVVATAVIGLFVDRTKRKPYVDLHMVLLILFAFQGVVSCAFGVSGLDKSSVILDKFIKIVILCFFMTMANRERMQIHAMVIIVCLGMGIHGVLEGIKYILSLGEHRVIAPPSVGDNNYLAMATVMVMPLLLYLLRYSGALFVRILVLGALGACFVGVIATSSRGGLVGLAILGLILFLQSRRKILAFLLGVVLVAGVAWLVPETWMDRMDTIMTPDEDSSFMSRVASWKMNLLLALDRPWLGGGYSALEDWQVGVVYAAAFPALDFIPSPPPDLGLAAHSIYFQVLGDLGFPGFLLFLGILLAAFHNIGRIRRRADGCESLGWAGDLAATLRVCLVIYMACGALLSAAYYEMVYILLMQVSILRRHLEETARSPVLPWRRQAEAFAPHALAEGARRR